MYLYLNKSMKKDIKRYTAGCYTGNEGVQVVGNKDGSNVVFIRERRRN